MPYLLCLRTCNISTSIAWLLQSPIRNLSAVKSMHSPPLLRWQQKKPRSVCQERASTHTTLKVSNWLGLSLALTSRSSVCLGAISLHSQATPACLILEHSMLHLADL